MHKKPMKAGIKLPTRGTRVAKNKKAVPDSGRKPQPTRPGRK